PADAGWNADLLASALELAGERSSSGVLVLFNGRIMAEKYWDMADVSAPYESFVTGTDSNGHAIEDVASAQKSVVAVLVGMAQERGFLTINDPVSKYLPSGWSNTSATQENAITIRHLLSMSSGLSTDFGFEAQPNGKWLYNTPAYHQVMKVVIAATGIERNTLTRDWITEPLGMVNSSWTTRPWADANIGDGFSTTVRELARFGMMIHSGGYWQDKVILKDSAYLQDMLQPSQDLNPSYGYLWWLNGQEFVLGAGPRTPKRAGQLIAAAPEDLVAMLGALDRKLYIVPSLNLIVSRLGSTGRVDGSGFDDAFWQALMRAAPAH
ncbi:MAG: serine hydrolase, partial [SAR86 cluster bacterium]